MTKELGRVWAAQGPHFCHFYVPCSNRPSKAVLLADETRTARRTSSFPASSASVLLSIPPRRLLGFERARTAKAWLEAGSTCWKPSIRKRHPDIPSVCDYLNFVSFLFCGTRSADFNWRVHVLHSDETCRTAISHFVHLWNHLPGSFYSVCSS